MANEKTKKKVQVWMEPDLVAQIDGIAARDGMTRAAVLTAAAELYVSGAKSRVEDTRFDAVMLKLDAIASAQGELKAQQLAHATALADAIKSQPIAVQQQELPAPEVTDADVQAYIRARRPDIALNIWGDPLDVKKKGVFGRLFGRG